MFRLRLSGCFLFGNRLFHLFQIVICLPLALKFLADTLVVDIDCFRQIVPNGVFFIGFNNEKSFIRRECVFRLVLFKIGRINDFYALRRWVKMLCKLP